MKEFKHPKLGRIARQKVIRYDDYINRWEIGKIISGEITYLDDYYYTKEELLALGFEEVVEEKEEDWKWYARAMYCGDSNNRGEYIAFATAIEKYMPKQKKFSRDEINFYYCQDKSITNDTAGKMIDFLRDHDLLEE